MNSYNYFRKRQFRSDEVCGVHDEPEAKIQKILVNEKDMNAEVDMDVGMAPFHGQSRAPYDFEVKSSDNISRERYNLLSHPHWSRHGDISLPTYCSVDSISSADARREIWMQNHETLSFPVQNDTERGTQMQSCCVVDSIPSDSTGRGIHMQSPDGFDGPSEHLNGISPYQYEMPGRPQQMLCPQCLSGESGHFLHIMKRMQGQGEDRNSGRLT